MMKTINLGIILLVFLMTFSCQKEDSKVAISNLPIDDCEQNASNKGFVFREDGKKWLHAGYTYWDPEVWDGINAFVLWDRETESLWWPLIDQSVSGLMKDTWLQKHNEDKWREITWGEVLNSYPNAVVLKSGQTMDVPTNWVRYEESPGKNSEKRSHLYKTHIC